MKEAKIGNIYTLTGKWSESSNKNKDRYEGTFSVSLKMGNLKWAIKSEWTQELKNDMEKELGKRPEMVYSFGQDTLHIYYILKKDIDYYFDKIVGFLTVKLTKK
jgi:hypothetical protein